VPSEFRGRGFETPNPPVGMPLFLSSKDKSSVGSTKAKIDENILYIESNMYIECSVQVHLVIKVRKYSADIQET